MNQTKHPSPEILIQVVSEKESVDSTSTCSVLHDTKNNKLEAIFLNNGKLTMNISIRVSLPMTPELALNSGIHEANCNHDNH